MSLRAAKFPILALALLVAAALSAAASKPPVNTSRGNVAVHGYDVVAYMAGRAVKGSEAYEHTWNGATWRFASAENRDRFAADPQKYAPQFGGYCAYAVSRGYTADVDPRAFKIVDGKLYLNYSKSVQRQWEQDLRANIAKGDANWPGVLTK